MKQGSDYVILRRHLRERLEVCNETIRQWIRTGKLPPPDVNLSRRVQGWRVSTLRNHGINIA
jgi:predicted site-specific integrase-resolvase